MPNPYESPKSSGTKATPDPWAKWKANRNNNFVPFVVYGILMFGVPFSVFQELVYWWEHGPPIFFEATVRIIATITIAGAFWGASFWKYIDYLYVKRESLADETEEESTPN